MDQQYLFKPIPSDKYDLLTKDEVVQLQKSSEDIIKNLLKENELLRQQATLSEQKYFLLEEQTLLIRNKIFGRSSEKSYKEFTKNKDHKKPKKRVQLPSERYPNIDILEKDVTLEELPSCPCCSKQMQDSGLTEDSEYLTVIPRKFFVVRQKRHKYKCSSCQDALITAPLIPRIKPGSSYSDEMMVDVVLSKYCDLIPVERYAQMATRDGVSGIPANSLIQGTHNVADFLEDVYLKIKDEVFDSEVIHADETPHKMLEGDKKKNWSLWGFSSSSAAYFDAKDTRSGDVASELLKASNCRYLVSDVFSGYRKAVSESNIYRGKEDLPLIENIYCNAHARRKFKESSKSYKDESELFLWCYRKIYRLEKLRADKSYFEKHGIDQIRQWQRSYFNIMLKIGDKYRFSYSEKSSLVKAIKYLSKNFNELTLFLKYEHVPIDNNSQERLMRAPVVGRKTWYGTHSKRGAKTNAIMFSLVESCKLNKVNPREYFKEIVHTKHEKRSIFTPAEYNKLRSEKIA